MPSQPRIDRRASSDASEEASDDVPHRCRPWRPDMNMLSPRPTPTAAAPRGTAACPPVHDARELTAGGITAQIRLDGQTYTLRITRQGKLILTK
jgi:hemin uptake protein HemP